MQRTMKFVLLSPFRTAWTGYVPISGYPLILTQPESILSCVAAFPEYEIARRPQGSNSLS